MEILTAWCGGGGGGKKQQWLKFIYNIKEILCVPVCSAEVNALNTQYNEIVGATTIKNATLKRQHQIAIKTYSSVAAAPPLLISTIIVDH